MGKKLILSAVVFVVLGYFIARRSSVKLGKVVKTKSGSIQGIISTSRGGREFHEWLGIPYAQPPTGKLRFASPQPVQSWNEVRDGSQYGSKCLQMQMYTEKTSGDEDCLYLNVHVPKLSEVDDGNRKLPVMVWIHGGYFYFMGGDDYRPEYFMDEDVVLVTLNYRLGAFGFVSTADKNIRGNMGLKDQALALKWIKDNIPKFGGDPEQITVFGESAGGVSVHYQTLYLKNSGLFKKAIAQSGVASNPWAVETAEVSKKYTLKLAKTAGCEEGDVEAVVECLRGLDALDLLQAEMKDLDNLAAMKAHRGGHLFKPVIEKVDDEDSFITQHPLDLVAKGKMLKVPFMTGVVADEGLLPTIEFYRNPESMLAYEADWDRKTVYNFGLPPSANVTDLATKIRHFYFPMASSLSLEDKLDRYKRMFSDGLFNFHMHTVASIQRQFAPVYLYHFNLKGGPSLATLLVNIKGKMHFLLEAGWALLKQQIDKLLFQEKPNWNSSLPILGATPKKSDADPIYLFSRDMVKLWVDFGYDKNDLQFRGQKLIPAEPTGTLNYLDLSVSPKIVPEPFGNRMKFLKSLNYLSYTKTKR